MLSTWESITSKQSQLTLTTLYFFSTTCHVLCLDVNLTEFIPSFNLKINNSMINGIEQSLHLEQTTRAKINRCLDSNYSHSNVPFTFPRRCPSFISNTTILRAILIVYEQRFIIVSRQRMTLKTNEVPSIFFNCPSYQHLIVCKPANNEI